MAPFENVKHVSIELHFAIEILFLESLERNLLLAIVCIAVFGLVEFEVVLNGPTGDFGFLIFAGSELRRQPPERTQNWQKQDDGQEEPRLETEAPAPSEITRNPGKQRY